LILAPGKSGYEDDAVKPLGPRQEPPRPWWVKWVMLALFAASGAVVLVLARCAAP
jgi:hypothetical protein